jgi:hypothetical protein
MVSAYRSLAMVLDVGKPRVEFLWWEDCPPTTCPGNQ